MAGSCAWRNSCPFLNRKPKIRGNQANSGAFRPNWTRAQVAEIALQDIEVGQADELIGGEVRPVVVSPIVDAPPIGAFQDIEVGQAYYVVAIAIPGVQPTHLNVGDRRAR